MLICCEECGNRPEGLQVGYDDGEPIYICDVCADAMEAEAYWQDQVAKAEETEPEV